MRQLMFLVPLLGLIVGCAGSSAQAPAPDPRLDTAGVAGPADEPSALGILGGYSLTVTQSEQGPLAELVPLRSGALGESFTVSGAGFFTGLCRDCLQVTGIRREGSGLALQLRVKHPFAPGNAALPPTATNRLDLDVFDLSIVWWGLNPNDDFALLDTGASLGLISDADGYSTELANVLGNDTARPYTLVIDDSEGAAVTNNKFGMGAVADVEALLEAAPGESVTVELYLTMGYGASATRPTRLSPTYFLPEFNKKAAWKVEVTAPPATLGLTWSPTDNVTPYPVQVRVYDWQAGATVNPALDDPTDVAAASEVAQVAVEIPGMTTALSTVTAPSSGSGSPTDPQVFNVPVANQNLLPEGTYTGLVRVTDTRTPGTVSVGGDPDTLVHTEDGVNLEWFAIPEYATYQVFTAHVVGQLTGDLTIGAVEGSRLAVVGHPFTFGVQASTTVPSVSLTYEWDNGQNTPGVYDNGTVVDDGEMDLTYTLAGTYTVDVRVGDTVNQATSPDPLQVTVLADGTFVDGDNAADPLQDGSWDHPFDTIQEGINAAAATGRVYIDAAVAPYGSFFLTSNRTLAGIDRFNVGGRPVINTGGLAPGFQDTNVTLRNLVFNVSSGTPLQFLDCVTVTLKDCKFTGTSSTSIFTTLEFFQVVGGVIEGCEFVELHSTCTPQSGNYRYLRPVQIYSPSSNIVIRQNEFHDIGFTVAASPTAYTQDIVTVVTTTSPGTVTISNNLVYDIFEPGPQYEGAYCYISIFYAPNVAGIYTVTNNTIDDVRIREDGAVGQDTAQEFLAFNFFMSSGANPVLKNNVVRATLPTLADSEYMTGFSSSCCLPGPYPALYSLVYFGPAASGCPGVCTWNAYRGSITKGTGSYDHLDLINPNFDLTPGPNFYHPLNATVLNGGEGGTQMGCFGGPGGTWTPPSQL